MQLSNSISFAPNKTPPSGVTATPAGVASAAPVGGAICICEDGGKGVQNGACRVHFPSAPRVDSLEVSSLINVIDELKLKRLRQELAVVDYGLDALGREHRALVLRRISLLEGIRSLSAATESHRSTRAWL